MPKINEDSFEDMLEAARRLARVYVPEWRSESEEDPGLALLKIFSHMCEDIVSRLNRAPEKNFAAFLDMLGIRLMPPRPSRVPLTFYLAEGLRENVFIPPSTQVATAETKEHEALTFETARSFTATRASPVEIFSVDPKQDAIYSHLQELGERGSFRFFEGENLQEHVLYLGHGDLFKVDQSSSIVLSFNFLDPIGLGDLRGWKWFYWTGEGKTEFVIDEDPEIKEDGHEEVGGRECIWIGCKISHASAPSLPVVEGIRISNIVRDESDPLKPDLGFYNFVPLDLSKDFFPFGRQPRLLDAFYFASKEAFSKKGTEILITFDGTIEGDPNYPINDPVLSWEYWNGSSWRSLGLKDVLAEDHCIKFDPATFKGCVKFNCPDDLQEIEVGGERNFWIRVRLIDGDHGRELFVKNSDHETWIVSPKFRPPKVAVSSAAGVEISYRLASEDDGGEDLQCCLTYNNLEYRDVTDDNRRRTGFAPYVPLSDEDPTVYLGFDSPFGHGDINVFISVAEDDLPSLDLGHRIAWHYWSVAPGLEEVTESETRKSELVLLSAEGIRAGTMLLIEEEIEGAPARDLASVESVNVKHVCLDKRLNQSYSKSARILKRCRLETVDDSENLARSGAQEVERVPAPWRRPWPGRRESSKRSPEQFHLRTTSTSP